MTLYRRPWLRYLYGLLLVLAGTLLSALAQRFFSHTNLVMIYLLAVVVAAVYLGQGPAIVVAILGVLAFDFFFVHPQLTLTVSDRQDLFTFIALFIVGLVISSLTAMARVHAQSAERRAAHNAQLFALSRHLAVAVSLEEIMQVVLNHVGQTFGGQAAVCLSSGDTLEVRAASPAFELGDAELRVAQWAFRHVQAAGRGTDHDPAARTLHLPLETARGVIGVLGLRPSDPALDLTADQRQLLDTFASQAALAIERAQLAEQARRTEVLQAAEKLQSALLNSISHDLRTPLVSIVGALSSLQEDGGQLGPSDRRSLVDNALGEAERLNRLVGNLLDITRIEAGSLKVRHEPCDVEDLFGAALEQLERRLPGREIAVRVPPDMPLVSLDFVLMEQVLANLLDNAAKYSPPDTPIDVGARVRGDEAWFEVADRGSGIPAADLSRVMDKFYRVQRPGGVSGTGLGLSICKGIVEAHGGRLWAHNREGGGVVFTAALPLRPGVEVAR